MVGITLSPEQIRSAPPQVRQWLEHEIALSLGLDSGSEVPGVPPRLAACTPQEAEAVYASVRGMFPVVNVFFELGREGARMEQGDVEAFRLADMLRHTRLPGMQQLGACLQLISEAFREIRKDEDAALFLLDQRGYCIVATETQRNILALWSQMVAAQQIAQAAGRDVNPVFAKPFVTSGTVPPSAIHLDGAFPEQDTSGRPASLDETVRG